MKMICPLSQSYECGRELCSHHGEHEELFDSPCRKQPANVRCKMCIPVERELEQMPLERSDYRAALEKIREHTDDSLTELICDSVLEKSKAKDGGI
jgi:hypothetical protein